MSQPDYDQFAEDHQSLLIVVKPIGPQINGDLFDMIYDNLNRNLNELSIINTKISGNFHRLIRIRYRQTYSIDDNDWGDFQLHRRLIGLITIGSLNNDNEIESISQLHKTIHDTYNNVNAIFDSKCFIIKHQQPQEQHRDPIDGHNNSNDCDQQPSNLRSSIEFTDVQHTPSNDDHDDDHQQPSMTSECDTLLNFDDIVGTGGQLFITSDHNCFTSRVNQISSSSSSSSSNASPSSSASTLKTLSNESLTRHHNKSNDRMVTIEHESLNYSLPTVQSADDPNQTVNNQTYRQRTHSRNKSLDTKLFESMNASSATSADAPNSKSPKSLNVPKSTLTAGAPQHKRTHSATPMPSFASSAASPNTGEDPRQSVMQQAHRKSPTITAPSAMATTNNEFIRYESNDQCLQQIFVQTKLFLNGLFWQLESKRLDKTREKKDKIPLLMAPFEKKDLVGLDTDTRSFRRKCLGRMQKHLADLSLLTGLPQESYLNYMTSIEYLRSVNDRLWLASAYEGLCAASLVLQFPKRWKQINRLRQKFPYKNGLVNDLLARNDYDVSRREYRDQMKMIAMNMADDQDDDHGDHGQPNDHSNMAAPVANKQIAKSMLSVEQFYEKYKESASNYALYRGAAVLEFECSIKAAKTLTLFRRYLKASDFIQNAVFITLNQSIDDQVERLLRISQLYEMIGFYRKAAFFKRFAALKTVSQAKNVNWEKCYYLLLPSLFGYGLTLNPSEYDEQQQQNSVLTNNNRSNNNNIKNLQCNWSTIHVQLLQEIITTSLKMQNEILAIRHLSFMLQCLYQQITSKQREEFIQKLSTLSTKFGEGSPIPLKLANGIVIPSVNFTKFPTVLSFKIEPPKLYLKLYKLRNNNNKPRANNTNSGHYNSDTSVMINGINYYDYDYDDDDDHCRRREQMKYSHGPFIYTPLQLNRLNINQMKSDDYSSINYDVISLNYSSNNQTNSTDSVTKMNFYWNEGHNCYVSISLHNYLPIELHITSITLLTDGGVVFEPKHNINDNQIIRIQPNSTIKNLLLTGIPRSSGTLDILGYRIHTLGIKSDCHLNRLPNSKKLKLPRKFQVEIVQRLPLMCAECLTTSDPSITTTTTNTSDDKIQEKFPDSYIANQTYLSLYEGQRKSLRIKLTNISNDSNTDELIELINLKIIPPKIPSSTMNNNRLKVLINEVLKHLDLKWNIRTLNNLLPFEPSKSIEFDIDLQIKGDFILKTVDKSSSLQPQVNQQPQQQQPQPPQTRKLQLLGSKKLANFLNELQNSRKNSNELSLNNNNNSNMPSYNNTNDDLSLDHNNYQDLIPPPKIVEFCIQFEYSGGPGLNSGFCRRVNIYFQIEIKSSILITHWDVIEAEQIDECYLVLDMLNVTDHEINLQYSTNKEMLIESMEKCRIPVPIQRYPLTIDDDNSCNDDGLNGHNHNIDQLISASITTTNNHDDDYLTTMFTNQKSLNDLLSRCRLHLLKQVEIRWTSTSSLTNDTGIVFMDRVPYSNDLLKSLLIPPIQSETQLNNSIFKNSYGEISAKIGEQLQISIKLLNNSTILLKNLRLYLNYYQDYQNQQLASMMMINQSNNSFNINNKIMVNGCQSIVIDELKPSDTFIHRCGLIFLYSGIYKLEICCQPENYYHKDGTNPNSLIVDPNETINNDNQQLQSSTSSLFKCLHTFEITIDE